MHLSIFDKANPLAEKPPTRKTDLSRLVNNTHDLKTDKFLTEISVSEASHCSLIDLTIHWMDGAKNGATSELRKYIVTVHPSPRSRYYVGCLPKKFQLARSNVEIGIIIANAAKSDILRLICVPEPELGSFVKTFYYVGYIPRETGLPQ
jgi:hypothetical protein